MDETPSDQPVLDVEAPLNQPNRIKKSLLFTISGILLLLIVISLSIFYFLRNGTFTIQIPNNQQTIPNVTITDTSKSNPQIEILATHPPAKWDILYTILFDPQSSYAVFSSVNYPNTASSSATITINGKIGPEYKAIDQITVSPDGKRVAYVAIKDGMMSVIIDGNEGKKYESIHNLKFSPDSQHIAYAVGEGIHFEADSQVSGDNVAERMFIVVDHKEHEKYQGTNSGQYVIIRQYDPYLSHDNILTYAAIKDNKDIIILDNKELSEYKSQNYPQFIGDTNEIVYLASENNRYFLVVAGKKQEEYKFIDAMISPYYIGSNVSDIAFEVFDVDSRSIILNGSSYPILNGVLQTVIFSPSGQNTAYYAGSLERLDLYINKELFSSAQTDHKTQVTNLVFSPNENLLAYAEYNQSEKQNSLHILSVNPSRELIEVPLPKFEIIGPLKFTDDGKRLYFKGYKERNIVLVTFDMKLLIK